MTDKPHDILRKARIKKGYDSAEAAARAYGWNVATYRSHENGVRGIRGIPKQAATRYAAAYNIPLWQLLGIDGSPSATAEVAVMGDAAFGVWRTNALDREHTKNKITLSVPSIASEGSMRLAIRVVDESVNKLLQPGHYAIFSGVNGPIADNALVVVERMRGDLIERTIRRYTGGPKPKLITHSTSPLYREELSLTGEPAPNGEVIRIIGIVVATHAEYPGGLVVA